MKNIKDTEYEEIEGTEEVTEDDSKKTFASKLGAGLKKNGKKIAVIAGIGVMTAVGYMLGRRSNEEDSYEIYEDDDSNVIDVTNDSEESTED